MYDSVIKEEIQEVLRMVEPLLLADGGAIEIIEICDDLLILAFTGTCRSCGLCEVVIHSFLERELKQRLSWLHKVEFRPKDALDGAG